MTSFLKSEKSQNPNKHFQCNWAVFQTKQKQLNQSLVGNSQKNVWVVASVTSNEVVSFLLIILKRYFALIKRRMNFVSYLKDTQYPGFVDTANVVFNMWIWKHTCGGVYIDLYYIVSVYFWLMDKN